jgi:hypothetical protein
MTAEWNDGEPPKDRPVLAFARKSGNPQVIVVRWDLPNSAFRPVRVDGDDATGVDVQVICWTDLPPDPVLIVEDPE